MGEQTGIERALGNMTVMPQSADMSEMRSMSMPPAIPAQGGMHGGHGAMGRAMANRLVPGFPQGMMDMPMQMPAERLRKLTSKRETRGMRRDWYTGLQGLMTAVRVLPPDLYDRVMAGNAEVPPGASIPGGDAGEGTDHQHH
jgi:hypothetical protein